MNESLDILWIVKNSSREISVIEPSTSEISVNNGVLNGFKENLKKGIKSHIATTMASEIQLNEKIYKHFFKKDEVYNEIKRKMDEA